VWKAIVHFRSKRNDLNLFVLDCDYGLGIITKNKPENSLSFSESQIESFTYDDFATNKKEWLNLKPAGYINEFFNLKNQLQ
jgi:hypothetical protein